MFGKSLANELVAAKSYKGLELTVQTGGQSQDKPQLQSYELGQSLTEPGYVEKDSNGNWHFLVRPGNGSLPDTGLAVNFTQPDSIKCLFMSTPEKGLNFEELKDNARTIDQLVEFEHRRYDSTAGYHFTSFTTVGAIAAVVASNYLFNWQLSVPRLVVLTFMTAVGSLLTSAAAFVGANALFDKVRYSRVAGKLHYLKNPENYVYGQKAVEILLQKVQQQNYVSPTAP